MSAYDIVTSFGSSLMDSSMVDDGSLDSECMSTSFFRCGVYEGSAHLEFVRL
jgi:hypothetical protein